MEISESERMRQLRHRWFGDNLFTLGSGEGATLVDEEVKELRDRKVATARVGGIGFQRCGGGYRVIRRKKSSD